MELLGIAILIAIIILIYVIVQWVKMLGFYFKNRTLLRTTSKEVTELIDKSKQIENALSTNVNYVKHETIRLSEKYKDYQYAVQKEDSNFEYRRYFATKKRKRRW